jgi:hypothetical protein
MVPVISVTWAPLPMSAPNNPSASSGSLSMNVGMGLGRRAGAGTFAQEALYSLQELKMPALSWVSRPRPSLQRR